METLFSFFRFYIGLYIDTNHKAERNMYWKSGAEGELIVAWQGCPTSVLAEFWRCYILKGRARSSTVSVRTFGQATSRLQAGYKRAKLAGSSPVSVSQSVAMAENVAANEVKRSDFTEMCTREVTIDGRYVTQNKGQENSNIWT